MWRELRSVLAMMVVQIGNAGMNIMLKLAINDGMDLQVLSAYRLIVATLFMIPLAFIFQRTKRPEFSWRLLLLSFLSGILGAAIPNVLFVVGLAHTTATFASAATILTPIVTFVTSALLRMESVRFGTNQGKAKVIGTLLGVGGALVFIFYKGKQIHLWSTHMHLVNPPHNASAHHISLLGALFVFSSNFSYSLWLLLQVKISNRFGGCYWNTALMNLMGSLVTVIVALCWKADLKEWRIGWNIRLFTSLYSGILISGMAFTVIAWCVETRGPIFVSVFSPVGLVVVALVGSFVLQESIHFGNIVGAIIIVGGLYLVLWRKKGETKSISESDPTEADRCPVGPNNVEV